MEAFTATNTDLDLNPLIRNADQHDARPGPTSNKDFVAELRSRQHGEERRMRAPWTTRTLGTAVFNRSYDPDFVTGSGVRPYNWGLGISVQQEVAAARVGERRLLPQLVGQLVRGRQSVDSDSPTTPRSASRRRSIRGCRTAAATRSAVSTIWFPPRSAQVDELAPASSNFAKQTENWQGVDVNVVARLRNGLTMQGGTSTGRRLSDACDAARRSDPGAGRRSDR